LLEVSALLVKETMAVLRHTLALVTQELVESEEMVQLLQFQDLLLLTLAVEVAEV
jgi:hypothetical protein